MTTPFGLFFDIVYEIDESWSIYDLRVAECHISNYGRIFVGSDGKPIDNEYDIHSIVKYLYSQGMY